MSDIDSDSNEDRRDEVTQLLGAWRAGEPAALDRLAPIVYDELRRLARHYMSRERPGHTMQATEVVNQAFVRMMKVDVSWQDRAHFFAVAARMMRRILVDHAKAKHRVKRGGNETTLHIDTSMQIAVAENVELLALDEALTHLQQLDPRKADVVELHFFGGLTYDEIAEALSISPATVHRELRMGRALLHATLTAADDD
ncbi:MAG: sigma-70 family RNA polymerase sigma factor [Pseudomonadota bacterium]